MKHTKLANPTTAAATDIRSLQPRRKVPIQKLADMTPLLEEMADVMGGGFAITSGGSDIFRTSNYCPETMIAQEGIIELDVGGRTAYLRFLRHDAAAPPALVRMAMLGQISAGVVHDINNMLAAIMGVAAFLEHDSLAPDEPKKREIIAKAVEELEQAAGNISSICRRVLCLSSQKDEIVPVNISAAVDDSLSLLKSFLSSYWSVRVENDVPEELYCMAVPAELQSCIMNILKNAIEHGFRNRLSGNISIRASSSEEFITISITNDGEQIPDEIAARLLKVPLALSCNNGIGLYTAAQRLRNFGAELDFESSPEQTTFRISLPPPGAYHG